MTERAPNVPKILCAGIAVQDIVMRVENFPAPGTKVAASEFIITGGGCAANAAVAVARLKGRVAFAGPLGGTDDAVSNRILADLGNENVDCTGAVRVDGGTASVSLILLDASGEKTIATRRGVNLGRALPKNAAALVADVDAVLVDNRFPEFVTAVCRAARERKIPVVIDLDQATDVSDPLLALGTHVVSSSEALFGTTGLKEYGSALKKLAGHLSGFLAITDGPHGVYWLEVARSGIFRPSRSRLSTRLGPVMHSAAGSRLRSRKAVRSRISCALPAPPLRSSAPNSVGLPARRHAPRSKPS